MQPQRSASTYSRFSRRKASMLPLPPAKAGAIIGPWLRLANLLPPPPDLREMRAVWSRIRKLHGLRNLAKGVPVRSLREVLGRTPGPWIEKPEKLDFSLLNTTDFMKKVKAAGLENLVSLRPGTEEEVLVELAQQAYFVLAGLTRRPRRASLTWVRVANEIKPQRAGLEVRARNPFSRFAEAIQLVEASRLHRCPVCNSFFYATREDAKCCSRKCSHTRRQHRFKDNWERYRRGRTFRTRAGLAAAKGKERRRLMELNEALRQTDAKEGPEQ